MLFALAAIAWWFVQKQCSVSDIEEMLSQYVLKRRLGASAYYKDRVTFFNLQTKPCRVALLGDSLIDIGDWAELGQDFGVVNRGISGDTIIGLTARLRESLACNPQKVVVLIGINDLIAGASPETIENGLKNLLLVLKKEQKALIWHSLLPINGAKFLHSLHHGEMFNRKIQQINHNLRAFCSIHHIETVDVFMKLVDTTGQLRPEWTHDGLHLNGLGYLAWYKQLQPFLKV
ncbi:MAG: hypothetical protein JNN12_11400 [Bacteroidetes Order II. Incertae sedis bacterium]|nr:hypothetical protein [Bacteroidetes Order II. bacterium]